MVASGTDQSDGLSKPRVDRNWDFDDVLRDIGGWGRFQTMQLAIFLLVCMILALESYSPILILFAPDHWCSADAKSLPSPSAVGESHQIVKALTIPKLDNGKYSSCTMFTNDTIEGLVGPCKHGWTFNYTGYFTTLTSEMNWVCDESWKAAFTQAIFNAGGIVGTLIFGYTADHLGRKFTFLATNTVLLVGGLIAPMCNTFVTYSITRFMMGLAKNTYFTIFFLLSLEYVTIDKRSLVGNLSLAIGLTIGAVFQPWLMWALGNWRTFAYISQVPSIILLLISPFYVQESVRWLASKGRMDECMVTLEKIAKTNGKDLSSEAKNGFRQLVHRQQAESAKGEQVSWLDLFRTPNLRKNTILMVITCMLILGMFDAHIRNISNLNYSIYTTFTISAALELPADILVIWGLNIFGRRWSAVVSQAVAGLCMLFSAFTLHDATWSSVLALSGRFFQTYAMNTGVQISFELVPTVLRGQGNALANVMSQFAMIFSPFIVYQGGPDKRTPFFILAAGSFLGAVVSFFLPETANEELPDTVEEAERFGTDQKLFECPKSRRKKDEKC